MPRQGCRQQTARMPSEPGLERGPNRREGTEGRRRHKALVAQSSAAHTTAAVQGRESTELEAGLRMRTAFD